MAGICASISQGALEYLDSKKPRLVGSIIGCFIQVFFSGLQFIWDRALFQVSGGRHPSDRPAATEFRRPRPKLYTPLELGFQDANKRAGVCLITSIFLGVFYVLLYSLELQEYTFFTRVSYVSSIDFIRVCLLLHVSLTLVPSSFPSFTRSRVLRL